MVVVKVPSRLHPGVIDIATAVPRSIDNGHDGQSRSLLPLEQGVIHLAAGLSMALGGSGLEASGGSSWTLEGKVGCPNYGLEIEAFLWVSIAGGADSDYVDIKLTTTNDSTGHTVRVDATQGITFASARVVTLRADLGDGTASAYALDQKYTLTFTRSVGGTGTTRVFASGYRLVPQHEITIP